ncbi:conserved hypothetical protein [uncultured Paludibacter sp.]|uniref:Uncharacterized protein n=1 Tax=uncultured Paludibacter sp. TaxID=497635 RepID=A0A653ACN2_9BACT|nr:conserved hypothetical protein [uncultured Paludibacter sp.]
MKLYHFLLLTLFVTILQSCIKDPLRDITNGGWNHERSIMEIRFQNQIGKAEIVNSDPTTGTVNVVLNLYSPIDMSKVKLESIVTSYQANSSVKKGETVNFDNASKTTTIDITSTLGETRTYTISYTSFEESLIGTWDIDKLVVYGGTSPEYSGTAVFDMLAKEWCWSAQTGPAVEYDNYLEFKLDSISQEGNSYGTVENNAGADEKYANFVFLGKVNPENPGVDVDVNNLYRKIPTGKSIWKRDYSKGTVEFTDISSNETYLMEFLGPRTETFPNNKKLDIPNNAFACNLTGVDDWTNIYKDYDKFVKNPRRYWILVTKR